MKNKRSSQKHAEQSTEPRKVNTEPVLGADSLLTASVKLKQQRTPIISDELSAASSPRRLLGQTVPESRPAQAPAVNLKFKDTIRVINKMQQDGVISRYAVGGAVGAAFYVEVARTVDVDIFIPVHQELGSAIAHPYPFADYLKSLRYEIVEGIYWQIEGSLVQFMHVEGDLLRVEAISQANKFEVEGVPTFVFTPEHLAAIALKVGRPEKDIPRILQFIREKKMDQNRFLEIVKRHHLVNAWDKFQSKYLSGDE